VLADDLVRYVGERVVAIAAESVATLTCRARR
jgi:hypothetical protein